MFVGVLSYSLYLWQQPFIKDRGNWVTTFPVNILIIFAFATVSYFLIEQPALLLRARLRRSKVAPVPLAQAVSVP